MYGYDEYGDKLSPEGALGLKEGTTVEEAKSAYRKLALLWHPDKFERNQSQLPNGITKEKVEIRFKQIDAAYKVYVKLHAAPKSREELEIWLASEAEQNQQNTKFFQRIIRSPHREKIIDNIWKLIADKKLLYIDFFPKELDSEKAYKERYLNRTVEELIVLLNTIFIDDLATDYVCNNFKNGEDTDEVSELSSQVYELNAHKDEDDEDINKFTALLSDQQRQDPTFSSIQFLIYLLNSAPGGNVKKRIGLMPNENCIALGTSQLAAEWIYDLVYAYQYVQSLTEEKTFDNSKPLSYHWMCYHLQKTPKEERFDYLFKHLVFLTQNALYDTTGLLEITYSNLVKPIEEKIASKSKKTDPISQEKVKQLQWCVNDIKAVVANNIAARLQNDMNTDKKTNNDGNEKPAGKIADIDVYTTAYTVANAHAENKEIRGHTNTVRAILKGILCLAIAPAALFSQKVRDGLLGKTDSPRKVKDSAKDFHRAILKRKEENIQEQREGEERRARRWREEQKRKSVSASTVRVVGKPASVVRDNDKENHEVPVENFSDINAPD